MSYRDGEGSPPLIVAGPGWVRAHDPADGGVRWEWTVNDAGTPTIACAGERLLIAAGDSLYCIDVAKGAGLWKAAIERGADWVSTKEARGGSYTRTRPTMLVQSGRVFVTTSGYVQCFDLEGELLWSADNPSGGVVSMSIGGVTAQGDVNYD